jgi:hypothetical protein
MAKGGVHEKSKSAQRAAAKQQTNRKAREWLGRSLIILSIAITLGCQPDTAQNPNNSNEANLTNTGRSLDDQAYLVQLIRESEIADSERSLVHIRHTCTLTIDEQAYAVVDMRELVKGATTARGINQIILLNSEHQLINRIEYGNARPLFCEDNKLYLHGDVIPDGQAEEGNVLVFADSGFVVTATKEDLNAKLTVKK